MSRLEKPTLIDYNWLEELWLESFGESQEYFHYFARNGMQYADIFITEIKGTIAAALYLFPVEITCKGDKLHGSYVYGVATQPQLRGQGLASALLLEAEQYVLEQGGQFCLLVPSSKQLFGFYRKLGYHSFSSLKIIELSIQDIESLPQDNTVEILRCERTELLQLRKLLLQGHDCTAQYQDDFMGYAYDEALFSHKSVIKATFANGQGLAVFYKEKEKLFITELLYEGLHPFSLVKAICLAYKASTCQVALPAWADCDSILSESTDFSMVKPLFSAQDNTKVLSYGVQDNADCVCTPYFNFAIN